MTGLEYSAQSLRDEIQQVSSLLSLEQFRVKYLGKKGLLTLALKNMSSLPYEEKVSRAKKLNSLKKDVVSFIEERFQALKKLELSKKIKESIDITLPSIGQGVGSIHPITKVLKEAEDLFISTGFEVIEGPDIEDDFHNFEALNIPKNHPARAASDTFYLNNGLLLRTQTSPVQIRAMEEMGVPLKIISSGKVYRCDLDATHTPMFHQIEGLLIDKNINFSNLKYFLTSFLRNFFKIEINLRFRASYFPFTQPSAEIDIQMPNKAKNQKSAWLEVAGCGMVHPNVFKAVGIDSEKYTGFRVYKAKVEG